MVPMYKKGGKASKKRESWMEEKKEIHFGHKPKKETGGLYTAAEKAENIAKVKKMNSMQGPEHQTQVEKKTGGKSMEPGGGGRFAALVSKLKGKGKSEGSAKAIAAAIGRKKYGKSKFQAMAAAGKKGLGGMSDSTSSNEAGMGMMEATEAMEIEKRKKKKKGSSGTHYTGPNAGRAKNAQRKVQTGRGGCNRGEVCFD